MAHCICLKNGWITAKSVHLVKCVNSKRQLCQTLGMPWIQKSMNRHYFLNTPCTRQAFDLYNRKILRFICAEDIEHEHDLYKGKLNVCPVQAKYGIHIRSVSSTAETMKLYEGWNFNFGNAAVTFDTAHLQSSYFHRPSMYSPKLCRTRSQR